MSLTLALTIGSSFAILFLGILALFHDRKSFTNITFFLISLSTVLWSISNFFSVSTQIPKEVLFWVRWVLFFATPHAIFFLIFIYNFPSRVRAISKKLLIILIILLVVTMLATTSPFVFSSTVIKNGDTVPVPGVLMPLFGLVVIGSLVLAMVMMIKKYLKATHEERVKWRVMLIGTFSSYILIIVTNFLFVVFLEDTRFVNFAPVFMIPTIGGMAYAILRHKLLNIKAITAEILTFVILFISFIEILIAKDFKEIILRIFIFTLFFIFGILLIKSVLREVRQREQLEVLSKELAVANEKLKELDKLKTEFLSFASHQLRSPLTAIKGYTSMLLEGSFGALGKEEYGII